MAPGGSAGVLAIELEQGRRLTKPIRAVATIFAALMAQLVGGVSASDDLGMDHDVSLDHPMAAFNGSELTPRVRELTPRVRELTPRVRELTPRVRELTPRVRRLTPRVRGLTPRVRGLTPRVRTDAGSV
jgi:hypothetical protein